MDELRSKVIFWFAILLVGISAINADINEFGHCMRDSKKSGIKECVGRTAISFLQRFQDADNFTITSGIVAAKEDNPSSRSILNFLDQDPVDFRGILENAGAEFSQRSLQWHMSSIQPGLMLRVGPSADSNSIMEFVLDPNQQVDERLYLDEETSTARVLSQKYLVPFLLGLKFNLAMVVPLVFAGVVLLLKKATFLAKFAVFLSTIFGAGGALALSGFGGAFGGGNNLFSTPSVPHFAAPPIGGGFGGFGGFSGGGGLPFKGPNFAGLSDPLEQNGYGFLRTERRLKFDKPREYKAPSTQAPDRFYNYEKNVLLQDQSGVVFNDEMIARDSGDGDGQYTNFGWKAI